MALSKDDQKIRDQVRALDVFEGLNLRPGINARRKFSDDFWKTKIKAARELVSEYAADAPGCIRDEAIIPDRGLVGGSVDGSGCGRYTIPSSRPLERSETLRRDGVAISLEKAARGVDLIELGVSKMRPERRETGCGDYTAAVIQSPTGSSGGRPGGRGCYCGGRVRGRGAESSVCIGGGPGAGLGVAGHLSGVPGRCGPGAGPVGSIPGRDRCFGAGRAGAGRGVQLGFSGRRERIRQGGTVQAVVNGPSEAVTLYRPWASVVFVSWGCLTGRPFAGRGPLDWASTSARLQAETERSLADEAGGPVGQLLTVPQDGGDGSEDDPLADLKADIRAARGRALLLETTAGGYGEGRSAAPLRDWNRKGLGANPPASLEGSWGAGSWKCLALVAYLRASL